MAKTNIECREYRTDDSYRAHLFCDDKFIGNVKLVPIPSNVRQDLPLEYHNALYLADINVAPEHRKTGLEDSLLEKALGFADEKQKPVILVAQPIGEEKPTQEELNDFYLKRGFRRLDVKLRDCLYHNSQI